MSITRFLTVYILCKSGIVCTAISPLFSSSFSGLFLKSSISPGDVVVFFFLLQSLSRPQLLGGKKFNYPTHSHPHIQDSPHLFPVKNVRFGVRDGTLRRTLGVFKKKKKTQRDRLCGGARKPLGCGYKPFFCLFLCVWVTA